MSSSARGRIEKPGEAVNVEWQTRSRPPTEFENLVGDALEQAFAAGAESLPELVSKINELLKDPQGTPWTETSLQEWLRQRA